MSELWRRLRVLLRRERFDSDLEEEMQAHVEMQAEENEANGIEPEEARYAARRQFGNATLLKERSRDTWGWASVERLSQDLRYGVRILSRNPAFTAVAVLCLALGTGANTAIFSLMDALLLRNLPIREPERLVVFGDDLAYSYQAFEGFRDANQWFSGILATSGGRPIDINIEGKEQEPVKVELISGSYFPVLGVDAVLGRTIMPDDDRLPGAGPMVVLSHAFWARRFQRDPDVAGRRIAINGHPFTVIGVAAAGFRGLAVDNSSDIWVPITMERQVISGEDWLTRRPGSERGSLRVFARLKPGVARQVLCICLRVNGSGH